jgi:hypothetical protein
LRKFTTNAITNHRLRHNHTISTRGFPLTLPMGEATKNDLSPEALPNAISWQAPQMAIWETIKKQ